MRRLLDREGSIRLAKAYLVEHEGNSLAGALADPLCPNISMLAALLHACGYGTVSLDDAGSAAEFFAGPTPETATGQLIFEKSTRQLSGSVSSLLTKVYSLVSAYEHELLVVVYLPPEMRRSRLLAVCERIGVDEEFFQLVLRNW